MKENNKESIQIRGARVNNLKNIDLNIPRNKLIVLTGVSGSGKSSLAFDTIFAEGQRRFAESLSSFARQFLGRMSKPDVDSIIGIPPAIAIEQKVNTRNPRSTIGSSTEIYDYIRVVFANIGRTFSPISGQEVKNDTQSSVFEYIRGKAKDKLVYILSDIALEEKEYLVERLLNIKEEGFSRLMSYQEGKHIGEVVRIDDVLSDTEHFLNSKLLLLIDRISFQDNEDVHTRLLDSIRSAFEIGNGRIGVDIEGLSYFSNLFEADGMSFEKPQEWMFNFNNPLGACKICGGYGKIVGIDESLVVPNPLLSIYEDAIACWKGDIMRYYKEQIILNSEKYNIPIHTPYKDLGKKEKYILWNGNDEITGINAFFKELESKRYKIQNKYMINRYSGKTLCLECEGSRIRKESLYVRVGGRNIAELLDMSIDELALFLDTLILSETEIQIASKALTEIRQRLKYIQNVGLGYLNLSRASNTLSGGETQRINLVSSLGNSLTGSMYILDEPSIGLHHNDTQKLISVLKDLRDIGNTVIIVEHDEEIMRAADQLIDIGPFAGINGGEVVFQGALCESKEEVEKQLNDFPDSVSLKYLYGKKNISIPEQHRKPKGYIEVIGACEHNLKNIDVKFPLGVLTAVVGASGSGKSTLIGDILYPALRRHIDQIGPKPGLHKELKGDLNSISSVEYVDQNPIGKSSRSNPATYLKIYDEIRKLFSDQPYAKLNGYGHSFFSFNIDSGRCPECQGEGSIKIPMQFMADIDMKCESCDGKRFKEDILEVRYREKNISDVLDMTIDQAYDFFKESNDNYSKRIIEKLNCLRAVGLNYVKLGQSSNTLSGGESQRVKLASFLVKDSSKDNILFIFDEPTTGLHFDDIQKLLSSFVSLLEKGHSIIVIEHNPYIIKASDNIIELGPQGGDKGGYLISSGIA